MGKTFKYYDIILAVFAAILLISNLAGTKLIAFGPIITDGGAILFPISYILGDVLNEIYGYKYARRAIWVGLGGSAVLYDRALYATGAGVCGSGCI